jgi:hypothetical protein
MVNDNFENENVVISIRDRILYLKYKKEILDIDCAKNVVEARLALSGETTYPLFVDITNVKTTTQEARNYSSKGDAEKLVSATALWGTSELTKLMANFFLAINKPKVPVKFFTDDKKGLVWLKQFVK